MVKYYRTFLFSFLIVITAVGASSTWAQSKSELTPEQRTRNIENFWKKNPKQPRSAKPSKDGSMEIPKHILGELKFEFEKRMAIAGHGVLFDANGKRVKFKKGEAFELQQQMLKVLENEKPIPTKDNEKNFEQVGELLKEFDAEFKGGKDLKPSQQFVFYDIKLHALTYRLRDDRRSAYRWREFYLWRHLIAVRDLRIEPRFVRWRDRFNELIRPRDSDYTQQCRDAGVPIPPTWTPSSTSWGDQGSLQQNILDPGGDAQVWTWAAPHHRGGCVALPRGSGGTNSVAGIICQNADNGNACIWDNISLSTGRLLPWATEPLNVNQLEGAPELSQNCTACHSGNNVFLVSPDDPTWCKLLRGGQPGSGCAQITGPNRNNFTLQVEGNVNQLSGHSRYTPLSGNPARAGWNNNAAPGCGGSCHLNGSPVGPPPMPPVCGANCN